MIKNVFIFMCITVNALCLPNPSNSKALAEEESYRFNFITRSQWNARPPTMTVKLNTPVDLVIIHHSYVPSACFNTADCSRAMRSMQNHHQITNGWHDIGYNFAVGSDGQVYEGRGWDNVGAHAASFNSRSIGIVLIGDWGPIRPPRWQLQTTRLLIAAGVERGIINRRYRLLGHRQVGSTECPGNALFREISTWDRFTMSP